MRRYRIGISLKLEKKGFAPSDGPEAAIVEITLRGGKRFRAEKFFPDWRPDSMPSWDTLTKKYMDCASSILSKDKIKNSIEQIQGLERLEAIRELMASIAL